MHPLSGHMRQYACGQHPILYLRYNQRNVVHVTYMDNYTNNRDKGVFPEMYDDIYYLDAC